MNLDLAIYDKNENTIAAAKYLDLKKQGIIKWQASLEDVTFTLKIDNHEYIANNWNFGELKILIPQIKKAQQLIKNNKIAIIRSAIMEESVPYIISEPTKNSSTNLSLILIPDNNISFCFPIDNICGKSSHLYSYIKKNIQKIKNNTNRSDLFTNLSYPKDQLIADLQQIITKIIEISSQAQLNISI